MGNVKFHQKSNLLTFVASVYSDGEIENSGEKAGFASGVVYGKRLLFEILDNL